MIIEMLFKLIFGFFSLLLGLVPDINLDFSLSFLSPLATVFQYLDMFISLKMIGIIFGIVLIRDNFTFLKSLLFALIRKIPFIG